MEDLLGINKALAAKASKKMEDNKQYTVDDIRKILTGLGQTNPGTKNLLVVAKYLKGMGFKVNESNFVKTFESFNND